MTNSAPGTDMLSPVRYVATMLEDARLSGRAVSLSELTASYEHGISGDLSRFRTAFAVDNDQEAMRCVIALAVRLLGKHVVGDEEGYRLTKPMSAFYYQRKKLVPLVPESEARKAVRHLRDSTGSLDDLVTSMKEEGWRTELGAVVKDQDTGIILSGNRRLLAAKKAGVKPEIVVRRFDGDYERLRFARNANAQKALTKDENAASIRALKAATPELTGREIGRIAGVPETTVRRALGSNPAASYAQFSGAPNGARKSSPNAAASYTEAIPGLPFSVEQVDEFEGRAVDGGEAKAKVAKDTVTANRALPALTPVTANRAQTAPSKDALRMRLARSAARTPRELTPCARCAAPFLAARSDARYCSPRCRVAAHREPHQ
jgi:hypothetical protein